MPVGRKNRWLIIAVLILAGEAIFFLPFVLPRIFRPTLLRVYDISNLELGGYFSIYGIVAMISYFLGGPLADRFTARSLMATALWLTGLGGVVLSIYPEAYLLPWIYGLWGLTTIFLFWAALIRATREWGGLSAQGKAFGLLEGGRGLTAASIGLISVFVFSSTSGRQVSVEDFGKVVLLVSLIVAGSGVLVWSFVPHAVLRDKRTSTIYHDLKILVSMPNVWLQACIIVCAYVGYKVTDDYALYAHEVLGHSEEGSAKIGTSVIWFRAIFGMLAGWFADRLGGVRVIIVCFFLMFFGAMGVAFDIFKHQLVIGVLGLLVILVGVYGLRGIYFAIMQSSGVPLHLTGAAVGLMSVIGYTPDVFMSPLLGYLLDNYPGVVGHQYLFGVLMGFSLIGLIASVVLVKKPKEKGH